MFENYKSATHLGRTLMPTGAIYPASKYYTSQEAAMGSVTPDALAQFGLFNSPPTPLDYTNVYGPPRLPQIFVDSAFMFHNLETLPENQAIIANLPASKKITVYVQNETGGSLTPTGPLIAVTLPLDGYGNVILFVPGGGLTGVWQATAPSSLEVVTAQGVKPSGYAPAATDTSGQPFFVSAGPDGDISNANGYVSGPIPNLSDDNIYSFNN